MGNPQSTIMYCIENILVSASETVVWNMPQSNLAHSTSTAV